MAFSKVILNNTTLMDVTADTVAADNLGEDYTAHNAAGNSVTGIADIVHTVSSLPSTQDTSIVKLSTNQKYYSWRSGDAPTPVTTTATVADVLSGKTAVVGGVYSTGTMPDNGAITITLEGGQVYTIPLGYHNGYGTITAPMGGFSLDKNQAITPYAYDYLPGYTETSGNWKYENSTNNSTDVYNNIVAGHVYIILLGDVVGTRFRVGNQTSDPTTCTSGFISGFLFGAKNNPPAFDYYMATAQNSGYLTVTKDNASTRNLKSYLYDLTDVFVTNWQSQF